MNAGLWVKIALILVAAIVLVFWALLKASLAGSPETVTFPIVSESEREDFVPGEEVDVSETVHFRQSGEHQIFVEYERNVENQEVAEPFVLGDLKLQIIQLADFGALPLNETPQEEYTIRRTVGVAVASVDIPEPGEYQLNIVVPLQEPVETIVLAFQKNAASRYVLAGGVIGLTVLVCGAIIWVLIRREHPAPGHLG